jgi:murein DD-endopeptidase MepM/ murein hydrolase activator NlpD
MLGQEKSPGLTPPIVFAICMAMLVLALGASVVAGRQDSDSGPVRAFFDRQFASLMSGGSAPGTPEPTGAADVAAAVVATDTGTALVAAQPSTPAPTPRSTLRSLEALRSDHYWLERPIAASGENRVARFYPYGSRQDGSYPVHYGVEMVNAEGTPVLAPASGVIVVAGSDEQQVYGARAGFYGQLVVVQLDQRFQGAPVYALFGHLSEVQVAVGQPVGVGQQVGLVGSTGYAEAAHLHSEVRIGKNDYRATVNPELWFKPRAGCGTLAGALLDANGALLESETKVVLRSAAGTVLEAFTYPLGQANPDPEWTENFAVGDLDAGTWTAEVFYKGTLYTHEFTISSGQTTWLPIPTD